MVLNMIVYRVGDMSQTNKTKNCNHWLGAFFINKEKSWTIDVIFQVSYRFTLQLWKNRDDW